MFLRCSFIFPLLLMVSCSPTTPPEPIRIGHLTEAGSQDEAQGIELALRAIESDPKQRPLGRQLIGIEPATPATTPDQAQGQTIQLMTFDRVNILIGGMQSSFCERIAQGADPERILFLSTAGSCGNSYTGSYRFNLGLSPTLQGESLARFVHEQKWHDIVVLRNPEARAPNLAATACLKILDDCNVREIEMNKPANFAALGEEIARLKPTAILAVGTGRNLLDWRSALPNHLTEPWLFCGEEAELSSLPFGQSEKSQVLAACSFVIDPDEPATAEFADQYRQAYQKSPNLHAALGFDAAQIAAEAMRRANSSDVEKLRAMLTQTDPPYKVSTGSLTFGKDQTANRRVYIVQYERDGWKKRAAYSK